MLAAGSDTVAAVHNSAGQHQPLIASVCQLGVQRSKLGVFCCNQWPAVPRLPVVRIHKPCCPESHHPPHGACHCAFTDGFTNAMVGLPGASCLDSVQALALASTLVQMPHWCKSNMILMKPSILPAVYLTTQLCTTPVGSTVETHVSSIASKPQAM